MIYLFHGSDVDKVRSKAFEWVEKARVKEPNLSYVRLAREDLSSGALEEAAASNTLFAKRLLVLIDDPFAKTRKGEEEDEDELATPLDEYLETLAESNNVVLLLAPKLAATRGKKIAKLAKAEYTFELRASGAKERGFNAALVDALAARNRGRLWLEILRSLKAGDAPEQIHGLLQWKARDLLEKGGRAWSTREARALSLRLISLLMETRRSGRELGRSLERFALSV